ncbi:group I truncated hemoglobin [Halorussus caseinilyticus]|uniref:Group 1 truncated hemoglobin n=1 Tax=Halorussus caseinilyticus TaxID=3034025 RepID=A0ABD5WSM4_9EURY|nr:group 1 truncated hemoglobin [Halorussus sp. DT72]
MSESLYERLGGRDEISAVVGDFYDRVLGDDRVSHFFEDADVSALRSHQTQFLAAATGGSDGYDGADLSSAHAHLDIDRRDFGIVADHLDAALAEFDAPAADREEVVAAVAELEPAIVSGGRE